MKHRPIYVLGSGVVSAAGIGVEATLSGIMSGRSYASRVEPFHTASGGRVLMPVGKVPWNPVTPECDARSIAARDRASLLGGIALDELFQGLASGVADKIAGERLSVLIGSELGGIGSLEQHLQSANAEGAPVPRSRLAAFTPSNAVGYFCELTQAYGPSFSVAAACAGGGLAIQTAVTMLSSGVVDHVLVGGIDAAATTTAISAMYGLGALSKRAAYAPYRACRPFDQGREGTVIAEGAGFLLLTTSSEVADPIAVVTGVAGSNDAYHPTSPNPDGTHAIRSIRQCLEQAGRRSVDQVKAHATGTVLNDRTESYVISETVPDARVTAYKGALGHTLGASAVLELAVGIESMTRGIVPAITNLAQVGDDISSIKLQTQNELAECDSMMLLSSGFGGFNSAVLVETF